MARGIGRVLTLVAVLVVGRPTPAHSQTSPLTVSTNLPASGAVPRDAVVTLTFGRPLLRPAERIAVFIDRTDVTSLFRGDGSGLTYERGVILLPQGRHELVVYLVETATGVWTEVVRQPFQTLGALGFQPGKADPALTAAYARRVADGQDPAGTAPAAADDNVDLQFRLTTEHVRDNLKISSQAALVGVTLQEKALRYRDLSDDAPRVDLSSYLVQAARGPVSLSVGNVSVGDNRHLINRFTSRGASLTVHPSARAAVSIAAVNGSNEVGWANPLGLDDGDHQILAGSVGIEAFQSPGRLRLELSGMRGSVLPKPSLNRGVVDDAEESQGVGARIVANTLSGRLRLDGGVTTSTFNNPADPSLAQGASLVPVQEETSSARYLDASIDAVRNLRLGANRTARLTLAYRHERVDPLYRSLAAFTQADRLQDQVDARAEVAGVALQGSIMEARGNLDDIASILTVRTERSQWSASLPFARVLERTSTWLPTFQYRGDRTHQYGDGIPVNAGFAASHVPDQVSLNQTVQADWQFRRASLGLARNRSQQDNRQPGREQADLDVVRNTVNLRGSPFRTLNVTLELGLESSDNLERDETDATTRWGAQVQWQVRDRSALNLRLSDTETENIALVRQRAQSQFDAQWSSTLPLVTRFQGQYNVRLTRTQAEASDPAFSQSDRRSAWWIDTGFNFTFF